MLPLLLNFEDTLLHLLSFFFDFASESFFSLGEFLGEHIFFFMKGFFFLANESFQMLNFTFVVFNFFIGLFFLDLNFSLVLFVHAS